MQNSRPNLFTSDDTLFGVCEALGEDFGFNPLYLRVTLAVLLLWNPTVIIGVYLAAGVVVAATRWMFPNPCSTEAVSPMQRVEPIVAGKSHGIHLEQEEELAVAA